MASPTSDPCEPAFLDSNGLTMGDDSPTDASSSKAHTTSPPEDTMTPDWSQWMCWDAQDVDNAFGPVEPYERLVRKSQETIAPSALDKPMPEPNFDLQGGLRPAHARGVSDGSLELSPSQCSPSFAYSSLAAPVQTNASTSTANAHYSHSSPPQHPNQLAEQGLPTSEPALSLSNVSQISQSTSSATRKRKVSSVELPQMATIAPISQASGTAITTTSKKRSHNVIEKRYRANLNDKIAELRDSVPSLRVAPKSGPANKDGDNDDDAAAGSGNKLNKASILSKATEYIHHLEMRNKRLDEENVVLKNRLRELDRIQQQGTTSSFFSGTNSEPSPSGCTASSDSATAPSPGVHSHTEETSHQCSPNPLYPPEGLIKVPESFRRMRMTAEPQPHYADSLLARQQSQSDHSTARRGSRPAGVANKFMLGTLAGLMVVGGLDNHRKSDSSERGLLSVPFHYLSQLCDFLQQHLYLVKTMPWHIRALSQVAMTSVVVFGCAFFVFLYLFYSTPRGAQSKERISQPSASARSPTEFRQEAWLTSTQTVRVPRHTFFPEWLAVTSRCFEYCLRCALGWGLYSWLTGISEDDEKGRVKTWDIALDAQLTGGDTEVSKSRLVLTIFASGTLPRSPARCMIKSLHCRILLWRVGATDSLACEIADNVARALARYQWQLAQAMQQNMSENDEDSLPGHLAFLLTMDSEDVLTDEIVQRASNLIWNRPTQEATDGEYLLDAIVEDTAIRSPLDTVAAWWSSNALQKALIHSFESDGDLSRCKKFDSRLDLALKTAPATSTAYVRAIAIKAVFYDDDRVANINTVLAAFPRSTRTTPNRTTIFVDTSIPASARAEISIAVRCAMIAAILKEQTEDETSHGPPRFSLKDAIDLFNKLPVDPVELTLLGFTSLYHMLHVISMDERLIPGSSLSSSICSSSSEDTAESPPEDSTRETDALPIPDLGRVASGLIYWVRNAYNPISSGFTASLGEKVVEGCVEACRNAGVDIDVNAIVHDLTQTADTYRLADGDKGVDAVTASETKGADIDSNGSRRASVRSADTGYGSMCTEDAVSVKPSSTTDEVSQKQRCDGETKLRN